MHRIGRSGRAGEVGLAISLIDHEDYHHFSVIEKKHKIWLDREQVEGFEVDEDAIAALLAQDKALLKPMAAPAGTGKKKRKKKQPQINADIWLNSPDD